MEAALRIRRTRQIAQAQVESKVQAHRDSALARQKLLRKTKSARDVTSSQRRGSIDSFLSANSKSSSKENQLRKSSHRGSRRLSGISDTEDEDDKSFASMGSFASSCESIGSIDTIGSTNSLRESFKNRRAQSARNVLSGGGNTTSIHPSRLILPKRSLHATDEEDEEDDQVGTSHSSMLRYCMTNHNPPS
jgi:hypothetical protein